MTPSVQLKIKSIKDGVALKEKEEHEKKVKE
jgi:hypothetical protein